MKKVLSRKPSEYLKQGIGHCGCYCVKAILQAYDMDVSCKPEELHLNLLGRITGSTIGKNYFTKMLKKYGIASQTKSVENMSDTQNLETLKRILNDNKPVMLRVGNGYIQSNKYNILMAKCVMHWLTLWGFDDENRLFYVYDPALPKKYWDTSLPVGNTTRTYNDMLRDWKIKTINPLYFPFMGRANSVFIEIK